MQIEISRCVGELLSINGMDLLVRQIRGNRVVLAVQEEPESMVFGPIVIGATAHVNVVPIQQAGTKSPTEQSPAEPLIAPEEVDEVLQNILSPDELAVLRKAAELYDYLAPSRNSNHRKQEPKQ